ncbi:MAG: hypothetical protein RR185_00550 [Angelakisella sp.]
MKLNRIVAAVLAAAMLVATAGCSGSNKSWVAQLGEEKISAGVYNLNLITAVNQAMVLAKVQDNTVFTATIEGKVGAQYINDYAREESARQLATRQKFVELGLTLTDSDKADYENYAKQTFATDPELYTTNGISEQSIIEYNRYLMESYLVFNTMYGKDGEKAVSPEEQAKVFAETFYTAYVVPYAKLDANYQPLAKEELDKVMAKADADLKAVKEGKSMPELSFEIANDALADDQKITEKGEDKQYTMVVRKDAADGMPPMLSEHLAKATVGSVEMVEDEMYRLLVQKLDETKTAADITTFYYMTKLLQTAKQEEFRALQLQWAQDAGVTYNDSALKHYTGERVKKNMDKYFKKLSDAASKSDSSTAPPAVSSQATSSESSSEASKAE